MGSNPAECSAFFFSHISYKWYVCYFCPSRRCNTTDFQIKNMLSRAARGEASLIGTGQKKKQIPGCLKLKLKPDKFKHFGQLDDLKFLAPPTFSCKQIFKRAIFEEIGKKFTRSSFAVPCIVQILNDKTPSMELRRVLKFNVFKLLKSGFFNRSAIFEAAEINPKCSEMHFIVGWFF